MRRLTAVRVPGASLAIVEIDGELAMLEGEFVEREVFGRLGIVRCSICGSLSKPHLVKLVDNEVVDALCGRCVGDGIDALMALLRACANA